MSRTRVGGSKTAIRYSIGATRPPSRTPSRKRDPSPIAPVSRRSAVATPGSQIAELAKSATKAKVSSMGSAVSIRSVSVVMPASKAGVEWTGSGDRWGQAGRTARPRPVPQPTAIGRRQPGHGQAVERARPAVEPERTSRRVDGRCRRQPGQRVRALAWAPEQRSHQPGEAGQRLRQAGRIGPPRMHRIEPDPGRPETTRPLADEGDLGALGPGVGARPVVGPQAALEVVDIDRLGVLPTGCHRDDARARRSSEHREQGADQGERPHHQGPERRLDAVRTDRPLRKDGAGVVDEDVEPGLGRQDLCGGCTDRRERAHVGHHDRKPILAVAGDEGRADGRQPLRVAPDEDDPRAGRREVIGHLPTEARRRTGDEHGPASQGVRRRRRPREQPAPDGRADAGEAADDRQFEQLVDQCPRVDAVPHEVGSALSSVCQRYERTLGVMESVCQAYAV